MLFRSNHSFTVMFRPNDKGHELAKVINQYNLKISQDIVEMREIISALSEQLVRLENSPGDSPAADAVEAAHLISQLQNKLNSYSPHS